MHVIALSGRHDSGKSETLQIVYSMLLAGGYAQVPGHHKLLSGGSDVFDVLTNGAQTVGIVTRGDVGSWLGTDLGYLDKVGCHKAICACRTRGYTVDEVVAYPHTFVYKTVVATPAARTAANRSDANKVYSLV